MTESPEALVTIDRIAAGGDGVGRWSDGRVIFVPRTAPGDRITASTTVEKARYLRGDVTELLSPGPARVRPECTHYDRDDCGGCQLQHLSIAEQESTKRAIVGDALRRIARIDTDDPQLVAALSPWNYRNKITLARTTEGSFGFHRRRAPASVFPLVECAVATASLNRLWGVLAQYHDLFPDSVDRLTLRQDGDGRFHVLASLTQPGEWSEAPELASRLEAAGMAATLWSRQEHGSATVVAGGRGDPGGAAFAQVNPAMGRLARQEVMAMLGPVKNRHVWDLYAGVGDTSRLLIEAGARVSSVEIDRNAVRAARRGCEDGPDLTRFVGPVERVIKDLDRPDLVVLNPPRTGLGKGVDRALVDAAPNRIVYLSCNPATLSRDLRGLGESYKMGAVKAFDLFPQTAHVETVAQLDKQ
jgi:23S rRNA (uracil1939-C5)-methyltransferase